MTTAWADADAEHAGWHPGAEQVTFERGLGRQQHPLARPFRLADPPADGLRQGFAGAGVGVLVLQVAELLESNFTDTVETSPEPTGETISTAPVAEALTFWSAHGAKLFTPTMLQKKP